MSQKEFASRVADRMALKKEDLEAFVEPFGFTEGDRHEALCALRNAAIILQRENLWYLPSPEERKLILTQVIGSFSANGYHSERVLPTGDEAVLPPLLHESVITAFCEKYPDHPFAISLLQEEELYAGEF